MVRWQEELGDEEKEALGKPPRLLERVRVIRSTKNKYNLRHTYQVPGTVVPGGRKKVQFCCRCCFATYVPGTPSSSSNQYGLAYNRSSIYGMTV